MKKFFDSKKIKKSLSKQTLDRHEMPASQELDGLRLALRVC